MKMKKICNFRPFLLTAILLIISIIVSVFIVDTNILRLFIFVACLFMSAIFIFLFFENKNHKFIVVAILLIVFAVPFLMIAEHSKNINNNLKFENKEVYVLGKVSDFYKITTNDYLEIILDDIEISEDCINVEKFDGKIKVYTNRDYLDLTKLSLGTYVFAKIELDFNDIASKDKWELSNLSKDFIAAGYTNYYNLTIYDNNDADFADSVKMKVYELLKNTDMEQVDIAFAMIFGDSNIVDKSVKNIYQNTGIAHLLAVSGLHVSAIVFALSFFMKKLKVSNKWQIVLLTLLLSIYVYLCSFSISVIRASLMAIILSYSYIRGKPYDRLSVISLLATVILLIDPMQLFNISFVLSFLAVLSIILLIEPIKRLLGKIFFDKFANSLALVLAVQIGLSVVNIFYFNKIQPLSFIANLISVPLATFAFLLLMISIFVVAILPSFGFICVFIGEIYKLISQFNNFLIATMPAISLLEVSAVFIPCSFVLIFLFSDYCFFKKKTKLSFVVSFCLMLTLLICF